jgi:anti-sigma factor RsiW
MKRASTDCEQYRQDISLSAGGGLPVDDQVHLDQHLAGCPRCRDYLMDIRQVVARLDDWESDVAELEPSPVALARWTTAIQVAAEVPVAVKSTPSQPMGWLHWFHPYRFAWGGIAALWILMAAVNFGRSDGEPGLPTTASYAWPTVLEAWETHRELLTQLIQATDTESETAPRPASTPRSELRLRGYPSGVIPNRTCDNHRSIRNNAQTRFS